MKVVPDPDGEPTYYLHASPDELRMLAARMDRLKAEMLSASVPAVRLQGEQCCICIIINYEGKDEYIHRDGDTL